MGKFGKLLAKRGATAPLTVTGPGTTHEGGAGFARAPKSELFLRAVTGFPAENAFYESAGARDERFAALAATVTADDPQWVARLVRWLRAEANLRSVAAVLACEYVRAGGPGGRAVVASACLRADEPGEVLAYWMHRYGRAVPAPVKRGVADAAVRLFTERAALRYDGTGRPWRLADVVELAHPKPVDARQSDLFRWLLDRRRSRADATTGPARLPLVGAWLALQAVPPERRRDLLEREPERLAAAGMSWETASAWLGGPLDATAWQAFLPSMGYMARLRNLRNFDTASVPDQVAREVAEMLADPAQVARSRQLPYRFLSAYRSVASQRWHAALEAALLAATRNVPGLPGRTLVVVDTSASMSTMGYSARSTVRPAEAAALFAVALAAACTRLPGASVDLYGFADGVFRHEVPRDDGVLGTVARFVQRVGEVGHGTRIGAAVRSTYRRHDRVLIFTDMQTFAADPAVGTAVPATVPVYGFNLVGYGTTVLDVGGANRHEFGGLSDATFAMLSSVERGETADWPF